VRFLFRVSSFIAIARVWSGDCIVFTWRLTHFRIRRDSNFIHGLPVHNLDSIAAGNVNLSDADRIRLVHDYITWTTTDGGLGVVPGTDQWSRVTNIMAIHDQEFNERWLKAWSSKGIGTGSVDLDKIKDHVSRLPASS
jgi:hypothetical protein